MAFIKKVFQDGNQFTPDDANDIQNQYEESTKLIDDRQTDFALSLYNEQFEGNNSTVSFFLTYDLIAQPIVIVKRLTDVTFKAETIEPISGDPADWYYYPNTNEVIQNFGAKPKLLAGEFVRIGYIIKVLAHAETHKTGGSDPIDIHNIGGLTAAEINEIAQNCGGIDEATGEQIAIDVKSSDQYAAVVRSIASTGDLQANEIAVLI